MPVLSAPRRGKRKEGHSEEYVAYLASPEWAARRQRILDGYEGFCFSCGPPVVATQVHHLHYYRLGREYETDLIPVCVACHEQADKDRQGFANWARWQGGRFWHNAASSWWRKYLARKAEREVNPTANKQNGKI